VVNNRKNIRLGDLLVEASKITKEQLEDALKVQKSTRKKLGETLEELKYVTEKDIMEVLQIQLGIPHINIDTHGVDSEAAIMIKENFARNNLLIPIKKTGNELVVAMRDPLNLMAIENIELMTGLKVKPVIDTSRNIVKAINQVYSRKIVEKAIEEYRKDNISDDMDIDINAIDNLNNAPIVKMVNTMIMEAVGAGASDIHIEPYEKDIRVRYRIDGLLREVMNHRKDIHRPLVTRLKIMSNLDIAERRIPQDGRVEVEIGSLDLDLRISTVPTIHGEKVVLRILDRNSFLKDKTQLGFSEYNYELFEKLLAEKDGILLATGPTGSGKSTTLYSILKELNSEYKNIVTVEDPVEYRMEGINQIQVNPKVGIGFANGLRSILRQDPDIIMIGEIRDKETAEIAVRAAITGHLVLSTLHTNNAPSTMNRLIDMGIQPYLLTSSIKGIIAQRLVKVICPKCKEEYYSSIDEKKILGLTPQDDLKLHRGYGCNYCNGTGYSGRKAIHEILIVDRDVRNSIMTNNNEDNLRDIARKHGMRTLREDCEELVMNGITTLEEYINVVYKVED
jgi:type IV pilus assembly protein PilB